MSEYEPQPSLGLKEFQDHVVSGRYSQGSDADWREQQAKFLDGELMEALVQHGHLMGALMPEEFREYAPPLTDDTRFGVADEFGDILWYVFDAADKAGINIGRAVKTALTSHVLGATESVQTFGDVDTIALKYADRLSVINKAGLMGLPGVHGQTNIEDHPGYVLMRVSSRLSRALHPKGAIGGPPGATELETPVELEKAFGDYLMALSYVASEQIKIPLEKSARFNMAKLKYRMIHGKENDLTFAEWQA